MEKIIKWTKTVPAQIEALLKQVTDKSNSPWYEAKLRLSPNKLYGNIQTIRTDWPEYNKAKHHGDMIGTYNGSGFFNNGDTSQIPFQQNRKSVYQLILNTVIETAY